MSRLTFPNNVCCVELIVGMPKSAIEIAGLSFCVG